MSTFNFLWFTFQSLNITAEVVRFYRKTYQIRNLKGPFTLNDYGRKSNKKAFQ